MFSIEKRDYMSETINFKNFFIVLILLFIMIGILLNPENAMNSAKEGLYIWLNLLLPSLFPFIFISNLLISFGFVKFLGAFLEPIMQPIFRVSGSGIFPFLISIISGYPVGAKLSASLRNNNLISLVEGNRLISFSSTSGPLFIMGTVMIGMLGANAGPLFLLPHYLGVITVGFLFRFYKSNNNENFRPIKKSNEEEGYKTLGSAMSYAVRDSMNSMLVVGGYVIVFTVIINLLLESQGFNLFLYGISSRLMINPDLLKGFIAGIIELTNGCSIVSNLDIDFIQKVLIINFLIGWGGFSINSQAISFISQTDLSIGIYMISKVFHGIFSLIYTYAIYIFFYKSRVVPAYKLNISYENPNISTWLEMFKSSFSIALSAIVFLILLSIFINEMKKRA